MIISKEQCEAFFANPSINPLTGRTIAVGKIRHKQLAKACKKAKESSPKSTLVSKPLNYEPPPMGPMIHWKQDATDITDEAKNMLQFLKFIQLKSGELEKTHQPISRMQIQEIIDILMVAKKIFTGKPGYVKSITKLIDKSVSIMRSHLLVEDEPENKIIADVELQPHRVSIRTRVLRAYDLYQSALLGIESSLSESKIRVLVSSGFVRDVCRYKVYLDYLVKHKIFSHDDIYKHTFKTENVYRELKEKYAEYRKLYKKEKGESPI